MSQQQNVRIEVGGVALHASTWGQLHAARPAIVLLHDSLGSVALWRDFPAHLAARSACAVVAYDRYGFGQSTARTDRLSADFIAAEARPWLQAVLQQLGIGRAILFGHSVGGGMAVAAAAQMPQQIVGVITESAQAFVEDRTLQGIRAARIGFADPQQVARLAKYHGNDLRQARWVLDAWIDTWLSPTFADWSLAPALTQLQCPVLALHGEHDEYGTQAHPQMIATLAAAFPGQGRYQILPQCAHVPHREQEAKVLQAICDFLADLDVPTA